MRKALFHLWDRETDYASYCLRLARLYRKNNEDYVTMAEMFKTCAGHKGVLIGYEIENAKYI